MTTPAEEPTSTEEVTLAVAAALLAGEDASVVMDLLGGLTELAGVALLPIFTERGWADWITQTSYPADLGTATPAAAVRSNERQAAAEFQASYLINATIRLAEVNATGDADRIRAAHEREDQLQAAHEAAQEQRAEAAELLAVMLEEDGAEPDDGGEVLLGWDAERGACDRGCRAAHGKNFNALVRPRIGYPGQVHPNCKCRAVPPWNTTKRVDDDGSREDKIMTIELRSIPASTIELREAADGTPPGFSARVVNYGVRDAHGTSWAPGVFNESLRDKMPSVVWGHDWNDPIGRTVAYREVPASGSDKGGLVIDVELDDLDAVPRAKQAYAQLKSGTMREFSFAFIRGKSIPDPELRDTIRIVEAQVDEFSVVLNGSVPGTAVQAIRQRPAGATLSGARAADLITGYATGRIPLADALDAARGEQRADDTSVDPMAVLGKVHGAIAEMADALDASDIKKARSFFQNAASLLWEYSYLTGMVEQPMDDGMYFYAKAEGEKRTLAFRRDEVRTADDAPAPLTAAEEADLAAMLGKWA